MGIYLGFVKLQNNYISDYKRVLLYPVTLVRISIVKLSYTNEVEMKTEADKVSW